MHCIADLGGGPWISCCILIFSLSVKGFAQEVGKVSAEDKDTGDNGEVEYRLLYAVNVNSKFNVDLKTGSISTIPAPVGSLPTDKPLDFEQINQHVLYIRAADKGFPSLSSKSHTFAYDAIVSRAELNFYLP